MCADRAWIIVACEFGWPIYNSMYIYPMVSAMTSSKDEPGRRRFYCFCGRSADHEMLYIHDGNVANSLL